MNNSTKGTTKMRKQNTLDVANSSIGVVTNLLVGFGLLINLVFAVFSKIELIRFFGSFWATILIVAWISLILSYQAKSRSPTK
jgi:hypothetical protein